MRVGRGRVVAGAGAVAVLALVAGAVWFWPDGGGHQSPDEIADLANLPDGVTPLDPSSPNPTGDDPNAIGDPPVFTPAANPEEFLARAERLRDMEVADQAGAKSDGGGGEGAAAGSQPRAAEGSLLVSFTDGTTVEAMAAALDAAGVDGTPIAGTSVAEVTVDEDAGDAGAAEVTAALEDVDAVEAVEPNLIRGIDRVPNDAEYAGGQASYLNTVQVPQAWDVADTRSSVTVAVLDTGVDLDHPDLVPNLVPGFDAVNEDNDPSDDNGHGTQVAGIIGAATGNGAGVAGVAWNARIMPVKVLDETGFGDDADLAQGIVWATDHGARVINMSLGGAGGSEIIDEAVAYALEREVVLVAAAGNDASPVLQYPAAAPGVYGVTATDAGGRFAWFSNHGPWYYLAAPGIGIRSTAMAAGPTASYINDTGTSFSSPIVAGVMALVREQNPGWGWFEVGDEVVRTARDAGPAGLDDAYGFGLLDASAALGVSPIAGPSQPDRTGDAAEIQSGARTIGVGANATETIGYEYDEDWFAFTVPSAGGSATVTVTPPAASSTDRAQEMDPVLDLYGPGGGLAAHMDETFEGDPEQLQLNVGPGRHTLRVTNWAASSSPGAYTVRVDLGQGLPPTAWLPPEIVFGVESDEQAVAVADVNGDGRDDAVLATGYYSDPDNDYKLFVFTQGADGRLGAPQKLSTNATYPGRRDPLRPVDLDDDGDVDLVRGTETGLDVAWNDGDGLTEPVLYPTGAPVRGIQVGDVDGAGPPDLVVKTQGPTDALRVYSWTGDDFTVDELGITAVGTTTGITYDVVDVNGDGRLDIATMTDAGVAVHTQQAGGGWAAPTTVTFPTREKFPIGLTLGVADVSGDGRADIVMVRGADRVDADMHYRIQQPDGSFGPVVGLNAIDTPAALRIADVNADGRNDVAVLHNGGETGVYRQTSGGTLTEEENLSGYYASLSYSPDSLAVGDLDGDGVDDLAAGNYLTGLYVYLHQAAATAEGAGPWVASSAPAEHATGVAASTRPTVTFGRDVNAATVQAGETVWLVDGRNGRIVDMTVSMSGRTMTIRPAAPLTAGAPYQVWIAGIADATGEQAYERIPFRVAAGAAPRYNINSTYVPFQLDLDGNGYDDIFWYGPGTAGDSVWFFDGDGVEGVSTRVTGTYTPVAGDFTGDGYDDVFWYGPGSATDAMWRNTRDGIVSVAMPVGGVYSPVAGDFDGNGYDDIFWYAPGTAADSVWYFGPNGRTSVAQRVTGTGYRPVAGDFTRDGFDDIVWYAPGAAAESLWRGGRSGFTGAGTMSITGTYRGKTLDFNGDGFDEVYLYQANRGVFWRSGANGFTSVQDGPPIAGTGRPVAGDFTGDGRSDLLTYVPGTAADRFYRGNATGVA